MNTPGDDVLCVPCRWKEGVTARKKLRRQMRAFPAAPCCVDVNNQLRALAPSAECPIAEENLAKGLLDLGHAGKVGISCTRSACARRGAGSCAPPALRPGRAVALPAFVHVASPLKILGGLAVEFYSGSRFP